MVARAHHITSLALRRITYSILTHTIQGLLFHSGIHHPPVVLETTNVRRHPSLIKTVANFGIRSLELDHPIVRNIIVHRPRLHPLALGPRTSHIMRLYHPLPFNTSSRIRVRILPPVTPTRGRLHLPITANTADGALHHTVNRARLG